MKGKSVSSEKNYSKRESNCQIKKRITRTKVISEKKQKLSCLMAFQMNCQITPLRRAVDRVENIRGNFDE